MEGVLAADASNMSESLQGSCHLCIPVTCDLGLKTKCNEKGTYNVNMVLSPGHMLHSPLAIGHVTTLQDTQPVQPFVVLRERKLQLQQQLLAPMVCFLLHFISHQCRESPCSVPLLMVIN